MRTGVKIIAAVALIALVGLVAYTAMPSAHVEDSLSFKKHNLKKDDSQFQVHDEGMPSHGHSHHGSCGWESHASKTEQPDFSEELKNMMPHGPLPRDQDPLYEQYVFQTTGSGNWHNIKLKADYSNLDRFNVESDLKSRVKNELVKAAFAFLSKALYVPQMEGPIKIHPDYRNRQCSKATIPARDISYGVADTDMVFYIFGEDDPNQSFVAYAGSCDQGGYNLQTGRPTVGYIAVNFSYLRKDVQNPQQYGLWINTLIHEVTHALGFNGYDFKRWAQYTGVQAVATGGGRTWLTSPEVVNYAKTYFGCSSVNGLPIEENGSSGSAGSHWERTSFGNEYMCAAQMQRQVISKFTLLALQSSGWYRANMNEAQEFEWGKGEGCKFVAGTQCISGSEEFCSSSETNANYECNWDFSGVGACRNNDPFAPNCGYWRDDLDCAFVGNNWPQIFAAAGGKVGPNSMCWETDRVDKTGYYVNDHKKIIGGCYESKCDFNSQTISVVYRGRTYTCAQGQSKIQLSDGGYMNCPHYGRFCTGISQCPNECNQRGTCRKAQCTCYAGFGGADCGQEL